MPTVRNQKTTSADRQPENADIPSRLGGARIHVAITAFLALFSIVGVALYGLPFFYDFMVQDFGWTRRKVTSGNAYSKLLVGPAFGFLAGWIVDRMGPRRLMLAGIMMAGTALVGLGSISTLGMFYFFYLFNALGYVCGGPLPNQVLLSRWYDKARGKAMGFAYLGIGIGGTIVPRLAHWLTQTLGWQDALKTLGLLMIVVAFPTAFFVKESPNPLGGKAGERPEYAPVGPVFRNPAFYLLALGSMCSIGAVGGTMQNLKLFLSLDQKLPQGQIANVLSLVLLGSIAGRLLMGWLADRYPKKYVMLLIYTIVASAVPLLFYASVPGLLYAFAIIFGIGLGGDYMIIPLMAAELFGIKVLGRLMGVILTADGVAEALSPMLVATIRDSSGSYAFGFSLLIILAIIGAVSVAMLPRRRIA
ncbi:MAG: MFS transporter [Acidobacteria bacterium]|nr:MAG: MFS transporter [Acidobacteriota bacterium]PYV36862.1 MAG: MFS transporter [Acidobacteriota bacterium]